MISAVDSPPGTSRSGTYPVFRLIYCSHNLIPLDERVAEHGEIFRVSRTNNTSRGVTGALLLYDDWFAQTLEGDEPVVRALFDTIEKDPRHDEVEIVDTAMVARRVFPRWAMARVSEDGGPDISLIATKDGMTVAASRGTTADQERLLRIMRALTSDLARSC